ncbi:mycothiol transferase [Kribbella sp. WER1]
MSVWGVPERVEPPVDPVGELEALVGRLEFQRTTLLVKCGGLRPEQLVVRAVPPSRLSLLGLVRHLSAVEGWFHEYDGQPDHRYFWNYVRARGTVSRTSTRGRPGELSGECRPVAGRRRGGRAGRAESG